MPKVSPKRLTADQKAARVVQPQVSSKVARRSGVFEATRRVTTTVSKTTISSQK